MPSRLTSSHNLDHDDLDASESTEEFDLDDANFESRGLTTDSYVHRQPSSWIQSLIRLLPLRRVRRRALYSYTASKRPFQQLYRCQPTCGRRARFLLYSFTCIITAFVLATAILWPSYNDPPEHYRALQRRALASDENGRGNVDNENIFIAASLYDKGGRLVDGTWGRDVLELIDLLGDTNVFLSIYENDSGPDAEDALKRYKEKVRCNSNLLYEEHLSTDNMSRVTLPDGSKRIKRIAYLAGVRNRALEPLNEPSNVTYDKVLFLNDVLFNPVDAIQLLFSTNVDRNGEASYGAACAVDFINPFKFYDTFATRDLEGYSMGVPFFPWFSNAGQGFSRKDVLDGKDAVRVKSCWGGMVAFDASYLQASQKAVHDNPMPSKIGNDSAQIPDLSEPIRFRAVTDLDWDASECCLIHADIINSHAQTVPVNAVGIYQNPYVRVAYGPWTLWWLPITRRFERLYTIPHTIIDRLVGLPWYNPRRVDFRPSDAKESAERSRGNPKPEIVSAGGDGYCGLRTLQLLRETSREGEKNWETVPVASE